jgi:hypothetical protein
MSDLDFDELDKAVGTMMNNNADASGAANNNAEPAEDKAPQPTAASFVNGGSVPQMPTMKQSQPPVTAGRQSGRFMDLVNSPASSGTQSSSNSGNSVGSQAPVSGNDQLGQTPFVSDPQVEKRPLGAFNDNDQLMKAPESDLVAVDDHVKSGSSSIPQSPPTDNYDNSQKDVNSSQSGTQAMGNDLKIESATQASSPEPTPELLPIELHQDVVALDVNETGTEIGSSLGQSDLAQPPSQPDRNVFAVDQSEQHPIQPMAADGASAKANKEKSGSSLLFWTGIALLLVIVGAAIGAYWSMSGH